MELNEKLLKFAGFTSKPAPYFNQIVWYYPENISTTAYTLSPPDFTTSLDACFKWLVSKLLEEYNIESYSFKQNAGIHYSETSIWKKGSAKHGTEILQDTRIANHFETGTDLDKITPLALCKAIEQLIDKESNES